MYCDGASSPCFADNSASAVVAALPHLLHDIGKQDIRGEMQENRSAAGQAGSHLH